jgi:hypothetical protein
MIDVLGRRIAVPFDAMAHPGQTYSAGVDTGDLAPGIYFLRLSGPSGSVTKKVVVVR